MKNQISHEELHQQLMYNPWTGIFYRKISTNNRSKIGDIVGYLHKQTKYVYIGINKKQYKAHRLAWLYVYGYFPENDIDHKNQIKHNNWINNLREASRSCNMQNTGNRSDNKSGVKGVTWNKSNNKWKVQITINQKSKYIGYYEDFDEAVCHRLAAEQCLNWEEYDFCSPAYSYVKKIIIS